MTPRAATRLHRYILIAAAGVVLACTPDPVVEDALSKQPPPGPTKRKIKVLPRDPRLPPRPPPPDDKPTTPSAATSTAPAAVEPAATGAAATSR